MPLPSAPAADLQELVFAEPEPDAAPPLPLLFDAGPRRVPAEELMAALARPAPAPPAAEPERAAEDIAAIVAAVMQAIVAEGDSARHPASVLFQDFHVRCRMAGLARPPLDLAAFARALSAARGGVFDLADPAWEDTLRVAGALPDDMLGPFLLVARAAREGRPCPSNAAIAETYGTSSPGRVRRLMAYIESRELIVTRVDLAGKRSIAIPRLGWTTEPAEAA